MRNYVNKIIKQAEIEYYHNKLEKERNQPRKLGGTLNEITVKLSNLNLKMIL